MRYFIADTHFAHEKLIMNFPRYRPGTKELFASIEEHDEYLLAAINLRVKRDDELFILGDFAWEKPGKYRMAINCKHVHLIRGNHDPCQKCLNVFGEVPYIKYTKLRGGPGKSMTCVLCHTPFAFWDGSHKGWAHLYGHCHGNREFTMDKGLGWERRSMDVGVDWIVKVTGGFSPLDEQELYATFITIEGHDLPSFYPNNKGMREIANE
jgi:calcineurin-like phosphoesterase family protein